MLAATLLVYATRLTRVERFEGQGSASTTCQGTPTFTFDNPEGVCSAPTDEQRAKMGITSPLIFGAALARHCLCVCRRVSNPRRAAAPECATVTLTYPTRCRANTSFWRAR